MFASGLVNFTELYGEDRGWLQLADADEKSQGDNADEKSRGTILKDRNAKAMSHTETRSHVTKAIGRNENRKAMSHKRCRTCRAKLVKDGSVSGGRNSVLLAARRYLLCGVYAAVISARAQR